MKFIFLLYTFLFIRIISFAQYSPDLYSRYISLAEGYFEAKDYTSSAKAYSDAFRSWNDRGYSPDRYNAACAWALAGIADSAFYNLERIALKADFADYDKTLSDPDLNSLHANPRWEKVLNKIKENKDRTEKLLNKGLANELDSIYTVDQEGRRMSGDYEEKYGHGSDQVKELWKKISASDSSNQVRVKEILDQYGWLGPEVVGKQGNNTLFLVIQHADLATQEKYFPMMKEAVANGKAKPSQLALLVDRIEMRNNRPQIYGSQITFKDGKAIIYQIIDEKNVNKRRAEVGLEPLESYVRNWGIDYEPLK